MGLHMKVEPMNLPFCVSNVAYGSIFKTQPQILVHAYTNVPNVNHPIRGMRMFEHPSTWGNGMVAESCTVKCGLHTKKKYIYTIVYNIYIWKFPKVGGTPNHPNLHHFRSPILRNPSLKLNLRTTKSELLKVAMVNNTLKIGWFQTKTCQLILSSHHPLVDLGQPRKNDICFHLPSPMGLLRFQDPRSASEAQLVMKYHMKHLLVCPFENIGGWFGMPF